MSITLKNVRRQVAGFSLTLLIASLFAVSVAQAATFSDVQPTDWFYASVEDLVQKGVISDASATYNPGVAVNRAEMAKLAVEAFDITLETPTTAPFTDVPLGQWYTSYIYTAQKNGILSGYATTGGTLTGYFGTADKLTRSQAMKILVNAANLDEVLTGGPHFADVPATLWSYSFVETGYNWSIVDGYDNGDFGPNNQVLRSEIAKMVSNSLAPVERVEAPVEASGDLTASISSDTPEATTLPKDATGVELMKFNLKAASDAITVSSITIHKSGVSALPSDFQGYLYEGNDRLTSGKSLNSSSDDMIFNNLGIEVAKGDTVTLTLKADMGTIAASGDFELQVTAITSTAETVGGLPVTSEQFGLSTTSVGTVTIAKNGTIANPKVGEKGVTIAKFKVTADTEAASLEQFGLYISGTISTSDIVNLNLYVSGETDALATVDTMNSNDIAAFVLDTPYDIEKGGTKSFYVTADLETGRNADTLKAYLDESTDIVAIGDKYGFGMKVVRTTFDGDSCTTTAGDCTYSTLEGGDITISSSGPTADDIAVNAKDVALLNFNITSVSEVTFKNFDVGLIASVEAAAAGGLLTAADVANFTDIKIINTATGETLMGPVDVTSFKTTDGGATTITDAAGDNAQAYYLFTDELSMDAGESLDLALTADIANNTSLNNETIIASLQLETTYPEIRDVTNKVLTNASSLVPSSDITGKTMTVKSAGLTLSLASTPVTKTYVKGTEDIKFAGYTFACAGGSDCTVTDLTLTGYIDDDGTATSYDFANTTAGTGDIHSTLLNTYVGSIALEDADGEPIAAAKSVTSTGTVVYSNLAWTIPSGESATAYAVGDLSSNSYANSDGELIAFAIAATTNVTAEDEDGNSIASITGTPNTNVSQTAGTYVGTSAGGSLTVAVDSATAKENILVAGSTDQVISKFKFTTTDESFVVKSLAINNRQESATTANLGNYDNNVTSIKLSYTNSAGTTETKTGTLTNGTAEFAGLDMFIDADDSAVLTVSANANTISGGAAAGEYVDLNLAFENFTAVAQGSGETYKGGKIDNDTAAASDLDFGTITWVNPGTLDVNLAVAALAAVDSAQTLKVDDASAGDPINLPVGTLLCVSTNTTCDFSASSVMVVTGWTDGTVWTDATTGDTVTTLVLNDADDAFANNDNIAYALPGTGYLTSANQEQVYGSKPTVTVDSSSPSGSRSVSAADSAFVFDIAANAQGKVQVRTAKELATCALGFDQSGDNANTIDAVSTTTTIDGSACLLTQNATVTAGDSISFDAGATSVINQYARASFWIRSSVVSELADFKYGTDAAANGTAGEIDQIATLGAGDCTIAGAASAAAMIADYWYYCDVAVPAGTTTERYWHFELDEITQLNGSDTVLVDRLVLYNDKIEVDMTGDDLDTQGNGAHGLVSYLKDGGDTVATGYVAKTTLANTAGSGSAKIAFFPIDGTNSAIEVAKGTEKALTVQLSTSTLLAEDAGEDDPLTFSIDLGSSTAGTVTAGDLWWNDGNFSSSTNGDQPGTAYALTTPGIIKWVGQVANTTISGNTVKY